MIRSVFGKIMLLFMAIIMISLFISGAMMTQMLRESYLNDNAAQLMGVAQDIAVWVQLQATGVLPEDTVHSQIALKAVANNIQVWVVTADERIWGVDGASATADRAPEVHSYSGDLSIDLNEMEEYYQDMLPELEEGHAVRMTTESPAVLGIPVITVGVPVNVGGLYQNFVFVHRRLEALQVSLTAVFRQVVLAIAIAAALGIVLTYFMTRNLLRPLSIVAKAAGQLARGHFDIWVEVASKDEIGQLANTFNRLASDLRRYEETRQSFVANVSHELRSPLTSMQGLLQGVIDGTIPEDERLHYLGIVLDETKRLNVLINELLDLTRLESGQFPMEVQEVEVNELIRRILITYESKIDVKSLMVEVDFEHDKEPAEADPNRLTQVISNLIDNAIKFANYGGRLRLATSSDDKNVFVSVNNSGEPIPRSSLPFLFDRFYKGDESRNRSVEGTGIGLSIVRKILEQHHQKIWVESDKIGGTTFTFTLRRVMPAGTQEAQLPARRPRRRDQKRLEGSRGKDSPRGGPS